MASHIVDGDLKGKNQTMESGFKTTVRTLILISALIASALLFGCRTSVEPKPALPAIATAPSSPPPPKATEPERSVTEAIKDLPMADEAERAGMLRAWRRVPDNKHFRIAQDADFGRRNASTEDGEIAGAYGLAAFIVDKRLSADRFSLVVFIRRPANRFDVYWIYRNMDLAKYAMSRSSGDIMVNYPGPDGNNNICEIQWDRKAGRWACTAVGRL